MVSLLKHPTLLTPEAKKACSPIQVLQVHEAPISDENLDDDYLPDGIYVCHAPVTRVLKQLSTQSKFIDAIIVGPECSISDILSIAEVAAKKVVPLILHTMKFEWKAKEIAIETEVDEYHIGFLDEQFTKRVRLIKKVKFMNTNLNRRVSTDRRSVTSFMLLKRFFDITVAVLIVMLLLPFLLIIVPLLMIDSKGPLLNSSKRVGMNYRIFNLYRFNYFTKGGDRRIKGVWKFLHKTHLVGLPQILNVLKGDMSLVGTCPVLLSEAEKFTRDGMAWRFLAPAGIVGLWRLNPEEDKTEVWDCSKQDVEYAKSNSMLLDIRILCFHFLKLLDIKSKAPVFQRVPMWDQVFHATTN